MGAPKDSFPWTEAVIQRLRTMWDEGATLTEIGDSLGCGRNAVAGKRYRLRLPERPNPIKPRTPEQAREHAAEQERLRVQRERNRGPVTLPPLPSLPLAVAFIPARATPKLVYHHDANKPLRHTRETKTTTYGRVRTCCYPLGDPGTAGFRSCDDPTEPGKSYCLDHCLLAYKDYVPATKRRTEVVIDPILMKLAA
jgi:GcrA cell cycle regulator